MTSRIQMLQKHYKPEQQQSQQQNLAPFCLGSTFINQQGKEIQEYQPNSRPICSISLEAIPENKLYIADCMHCFDIKEIKEWVEKKHKLECPLCNRKTIGFSVESNGELKYYVGNRHWNRMKTGEEKFGGWVDLSSKVGDDVYLGKNALVFDKARVFDQTKIFGSCLIHGKKTLIFGNTQIHGKVNIFDSQIYENAIIKATEEKPINIIKSKIHGNIEIKGPQTIVSAKLPSTRRLFSLLRLPFR